MSAAPITPLGEPAPVASAASVATTGAPENIVKLEQPQEDVEQLDPLIDGIGPADGEGSIRIIREVCGSPSSFGSACAWNCLWKASMVLGARVEGEGGDVREPCVLWSVSWR